MSKLKILTEQQLEELRKGKTSISYSQFSMYNQCPYRWYKNYAEGIKTFDYGVHLLFGTAIHETLQTYITALYSVGGKKADEMDLNNLLLDRMKETFISAQNNGYTDFTTKEELAEFYQDGVAILNFIKKKRSEYFGLKNFELIGIEIPILTQVYDDNPNILIYGFLDLVIRDTILDRYYVKDIKTSTMGWNKYQKEDENKIAQLLLYKEYFSKQYNIPKEKIDIEFFIVKRRLYENVEFAQKRVQSFKPPETKKVLKNLDENLKAFINTAFNLDGTINTNSKFVKNASDKICRWCEFNNTEHCDKKN